jgi:D-beta-D-heptose 7-phosphate kinase / D-beta-D-heptose 1-phosphate adenosyltransferase
VRQASLVLAAFEVVDPVVVFDEGILRRLIEKVQPMLFVKGRDYRREDMVGREVVEVDGGEAVIVATMPGHTTSAIVPRFRNL